MAQGFNDKERGREIVALTSENRRLRCALADIEALAETLAEAKRMASTALEKKST